MFTDLTATRLEQELEALGTPANDDTIRRWMDAQNLRLRKIRKVKSGGTSADRDAQFQNIAQLIEQYEQAGNPYFSVDSKAKEFLSQPYSRELKLTPEGEFLAPSWQRYVTLASPASSLDDVLMAFIIGLDARTKPYDMHLAIFRYEDWADYGTVKAPTLLLSGEDDFFVNQERLDYTCTLFPDCEVHPLIPGAGAFIGAEQPEAYAEAIIEFLQAQ